MKDDSEISVRTAVENDSSAVSSMFAETIRNVNKRDYTSDQIEVWVSGFDDLEKWKKKIKGQHFYVAEIKGKIVGFGSVTNDGYLDFMFTHKDYQGKGIATLLVNEIEKKSYELKQDKIWAVVSITARPFFKSRGFKITKRYKKYVGNVEFDDAEMTKILL